MVANPNFQQQLLQSSVSHDTSEIILKAAYLMLKTHFERVVLLNIFVGNMTHFFDE